MGASLLDAVLAETLDPAYAQAAQARAARAAPDVPASTAGPHRARRWRAQLLVGLTMAIAGVLAAVTYHQAAVESQGRAQVRTALVGDIQDASAVTDELASELEGLRAEVSSTREELLAASAVGQQALDELARAEQGAAAVPVSGPGLLVTLANADPAADEDPVGGATEEDPRGRVRDGDLQLVVNALWAAGAEAVGINGQRLGPTSAIRFAGEAVLVDFRPVTNPYEISAIGDPDTLSSSFLASPEVGALALISESFDLRFEFAQEDELSLPPASTPELRSARADTPAQDSPAQDSPAQDSPEADPTPGGGR
jgi:uncharacterized protein YlxW (UPF0749 family)